MGEGTIQEKDPGLLGQTEASETGQSGTIQLGGRRAFRDETEVEIRLRRLEQTVERWVNGLAAVAALEAQEMALGQAYRQFGREVTVERNRITRWGNDQIAAARSATDDQLARQEMLARYEVLDAELERRYAQYWEAVEARHAAQQALYAAVLGGEQP